MAGHIKAVLFTSLAPAISTSPLHSPHQGTHLHARPSYPPGSPQRIRAGVSPGRPQCLALDAEPSQVALLATRIPCDHHLCARRMNRRCITTNMLITFTAATLAAPGAILSKHNPDASPSDGLAHWVRLPAPSLAWQPPPPQPPPRLPQPCACPMPPPWRCSAP